MHRFRKYCCYVFVIMMTYFVAGVQSNISDDNDKDKRYISETDNSGTVQTCIINYWNCIAYITARAAVLARYILAVVILSVCPSVCHTRALWQNQTMFCEYFDTTRKGNHSRFLTSTMDGGRCPLPSEICAQSDLSPSTNADFDRFPLIRSQPKKIAKKVQLWQRGSRQGFSSEL